jgi:hypothetical protein
MNNLLERNGLSWDDIAKVTFHTTDDNGKYEVERLEWSHDDRDHVFATSQIMGTDVWEAAKAKYNLEIIDHDGHRYLARRNEEV